MENGMTTLPCKSTKQVVNTRLQLKTFYKEVCILCQTAVYKLMVRNSQNVNCFREFANQKSLNLVKVQIHGSFSE